MNQKAFEYQKRLYELADIYFNDTDVNNLATNLEAAIKFSATESGMLVVKKISSSKVTIVSHKPWFNSHCKHLKKRCRYLLRRYRKSLSQDDLSTYLDSKKCYLTALKTSKKKNILR